MPPTDVCLNPVCPLWPSEVVSIIDAAEQAQPHLYHELQESEQRLLAEIIEWKPGLLARFAYKARAELITMFLRKGIMPSVDHFFAIGELLLLVNKQPSHGTNDDLEGFRVLLESVRLWSQDQLNLEDLQTRRYVLGRTDSGIRGFSIKFAHAISESHATMGIGSYKRTSSMFPYFHLESAATTHVDPSRVTDASEILETFWPTSLQLRYVLRSHYRMAKQYDYRPDILDMTVLFGWCMSTWGRDESWIIPAEKESKEIQELQAHFDKYAIRPFSAQEFVRNYIDSTELVPIAVRTAEGFLLDSITLLFFVIYLQGCPNPELPAVAERGPLLVNMRVKVGEKFEEWLRKEIHRRGYRGPDQPVTVEKRYEYDIMAISEEKKRIIIADAKYRDIAPSSFTGTNLIPQELLGEHGLRDESSRQQERLDFFRKNLPKFDQYLKPERPWGEYEICSYLITKHFPLAHRYKETRIARAIEFLAADV
ncbi:MAG: hypothetical protein V1724_03140 [Chloroflexota bacterium]